MIKILTQIYALQSLASNTSKLVSTVSFADDDFGGSSIYFHGKDARIVFQAGEVGGRNGSVILCTPIYEIMGTDQAAKKYVPEHNYDEQIALDKQTSDMQDSQTFCINGELANNSSCICKTGFFGDNCWSDQCVGSNANFTNTIEGVIRSQSTPYYKAGARTCSWWIKPAPERVVVTDVERRVQLTGNNSCCRGL